MAWGSNKPAHEEVDPLLEYERDRRLQRSGTWYGFAGEHGVRFLPERSPGAEAGPLVAQLCRFGQQPDKTPVLLVHGASAWRGTFMEQGGGLIRHLLRDRDVWTLDWRASKVITDHQRALGGTAPDALRAMNLDLPVAQELPQAIEHVAAFGNKLPHLVGHCMGAALISTAIARGQLAGLMPEKLVLSALGLFYRGTVDTWFRADERIDTLSSSSPSEPWYLDFGSPEDLPQPYQEVFELWKKTPYLHCEVLFCQRLSAILGCPYRPDDLGYLHDALHDGLCSQFGVMPTGILGHCARNVRRGWSGTRLASDTDREDLEHPQRFLGVREVTLLTGNENQLWHRDCIDRMYEWLQRVGPWPRTAAGRPALEKRIFERFGHQDLFLSPLAGLPGSVYDYVRERLD